MTLRRNVLVGLSAALGATALAAPAASATTTPTLRVHEVYYDWHWGQYYGYGHYGLEEVRVTYTCISGRRTAVVRPIEYPCGCSYPSSVVTTDTGQWTCFQGCYYRVVVKTCGFHEGGGSGSGTPS